mmetsp:Transcript_67351/g.187882  ORF Transcript_67351/g.187882 Transcript_67351/m.187882 type:complete len:159 (+) Transcript_67351:75-551(+)
MALMGRTLRLLPAAAKATRRAPAVWGVPALRAFSSVKYQASHEWLRLDANGEGTLGISDFAQGALGEVVYVDLPSEGATFKTKDTICTLESVKAVGEAYAPVDCEVIEVNEKLNDEPTLVNSSCMEDGWLVKIKYTGDLSNLMDQAAYEKHLEDTKDE